MSEEVIRHEKGNSINYLYLQDVWINIARPLPPRLIVRLTTNIIILTKYSQNERKDDKLDINFMTRLSIMTVQEKWTLEITLITLAIKRSLSACLWFVGLFLHSIVRLKRTNSGTIRAARIL